MTGKEEGEDGGGQARSVSQCRIDGRRDRPGQIEMRWVGDGSDDEWVREWKRTSKRMSNSFARKAGPGTMRTTRAVRSARPRH